MYNCPCLSNTLQRFSVIYLLVLLLPALSLPAPAQAAPDTLMQQSLKAFFKHGVVVHGASAELIRIERWPATQGAVHWSLPGMHGHPKRFSLIAEQAGKRWYVPVQVHWWATAVVMKKTVPARTLLTQAMLLQTRSDIAGHNGSWVQHPADLTGMRLTRRMNQGDVIMNNQVTRPPLIKRGDLVTIVLDMGSLHIRTAGKALRSARQGERVMVKNLRSKTVVQAIAEQAGMVRIASGRVSG